MSLESKIETHKDRILLHAILAREYLGHISSQSYFHRKFGYDADWGTINPWDISFSDKRAEKLHEELGVDTKRIKDAFSFLMTESISDSINNSGAFFLIPSPYVNMVNVQFECAYDRLGYAMENICNNINLSIPSFRSLDQNSAIEIMNSLNKKLSFECTYGWYLDDDETEVISSIKEKYLREAQKKFNKEIMKKYNLPGKLEMPLLNDLQRKDYKTHRLNSISIIKQLDISLFSKCYSIIAIPDDEAILHCPGNGDLSYLSIRMHNYGNEKIWALRSEIGIDHFVRTESISQISEKYALIDEVKNILCEKYPDKQFKWDKEKIKEEHMQALSLETK
jgi:hypothetical protein